MRESCRYARYTYSCMSLQLTRIGGASAASRSLACFSSPASAPFLTFDQITPPIPEDRSIADMSELAMSDLCSAAALSAGDTLASAFLSQESQYWLNESSLVSE